MYFLFSGSNLQKDDTSSKCLIKNILERLWLQFSVHSCSIGFQYAKWYYFTRQWYFDIPKISLFIINFAAIIITNQYIMANNDNNLEQKGCLYICTPTLETLVLPCINVKDAEHASGIEYSNFLKACKLEKDIRLSTYRKCAAGLGMDVLIVHLPHDIVRKLINSKPHARNRYETIEQDEIIEIFRESMLGGMRIDELLTEFITHLTKHEKDHLMRPFLMAIVELCQKLIDEDGKQ